MSNEATSWSVRQDAGGSGPKLLLMILANHAGKDGVAYPGRKLLAEECNYRSEAVTANFARLEAKGLVARVERRRGNGSRTSDWSVLAPLAADRGDMVDATDERPEEVATLARRSADSVGESGADSVGEVRCGKRTPSGAENAPGQVRKAGGPEPSEEPSEEPTKETPLPLRRDERRQQRRKRARGSRSTTSARDEQRVSEEAAWLAEHPRTPELDMVWKPIRSELIAAFGEATFATFLARLHLHHADGDGLVIGCEQSSCGWTQDRFVRSIQRIAAGKPVQLVACRCESQEQVTAGTVAEGLPSASAYDSRSERAA